MPVGTLDRAILMGDPGVVAGRFHAVMRAECVVTRGQVRPGVIVEVAKGRR